MKKHVAGKVNFPISTFVKLTMWCEQWAGHIPRHEWTKETDSIPEERATGRATVSCSIADILNVPHILTSWKLFIWLVLVFRWAFGYKRLPMSAWPAPRHLGLGNAAYKSISSTHSCSLWLWWCCLMLFLPVFISHSHLSGMTLVPCTEVWEELGT